MLYKIFVNETQYNCNVIPNIFKAERDSRVLNYLPLMKGKLSFLNKLLDDLKFSFTPGQNSYSEFSEKIENYEKNLKIVIEDSKKNIFYLEDFMALTDSAEELKTYSKSHDMSKLLSPNEYLFALNSLSIVSLTTLGSACLLHLFSSKEQSFFSSFKKGSILGVASGIAFLFLQVEDYLQTYSRIDNIYQHCTANEELLGNAYKLCEEVI